MNCVVLSADSTSHDTVAMTTGLSVERRAVDVEGLEGCSGENAGSTFFKAINFSRSVVRDSDLFCWLVGAFVKKVSIARIFPTIPQDEMRWTSYHELERRSPIYVGPPDFEPSTKTASREPLNNIRMQVQDLVQVENHHSSVVTPEGMPRAIDFGGDGRGCMVQHGKSTYDRACCSSSPAVYASKLPWKSSDSSEEIKRQDTHIPFKTLTASARYLLFAIPRQVDRRRIALKVNLRATTFVSPPSPASSFVLWRAATCEVYVLLVADIPERESRARLCGK